MHSRAELQKTKEELKSFASRLDNKFIVTNFRLSPQCHIAAEEYKSQLYYSFKYDNSGMCFGSVNLFECTSGRIIKLIVYCISTPLSLTVIRKVLLLLFRYLNAFMPDVFKSNLRYPRTSSEGKIIKKAT